MKVLLDSLHLNVHTQEFYPNKLQPHKIKSKPVSGSKRVNTICIIISRFLEPELFWLGIPMNSQSKVTIKIKKFPKKIV